jgi:hypothetical protein
MSRADSKNKSQAMAHYMRSHPGQYPDSVSGGGWNGWARRLHRGWIGGLLAHAIGFTCPLTDNMIKQMKEK